MLISTRSGSVDTRPFVLVTTPSGIWVFRDMDSMTHAKSTDEIHVCGVL